MTPIAIVFFVLAAVVIWGGLTASIIYLARHTSSRLEFADTEPSVPDGPDL